MKTLDLEAMGLTELDFTEKQTINGGFIPKSSSISQIQKDDKEEQEEVLIKDKNN